MNNDPIETMYITPIGAKKTYNKRGDKRVPIEVGADVIKRLLTEKGVKLYYHPAVDRVILDVDAGIADLIGVLEATRQRRYVWLGMGRACKELGITSGALYDRVKRGKIETRPHPRGLKWKQYKVEVK